MLSTVPLSNLLVVAPDGDLRGSLAFMFEAEGFAVRTCAFWPPDPTPDGTIAQYDVLIVDDDALPREFMRGFTEDALLHAFGSKLVLLGGRADLWARLPQATAIAKPLLDRILLDTVRALLGLGNAKVPQSK